MKLGRLAKSLAMGVNAKRRAKGLLPRPVCLIYWWNILLFGMSVLKYLPFFLGFGFGFGFWLWYVIFFFCLCHEAQMNVHVSQSFLSCHEHSSSLDNIVIYKVEYCEFMS